MSRTWREEIANIQWPDLALHVGIGMVATLVLWSLYGNLGLIYSMIFNMAFWPVRELRQSGTWSPWGWSLKKWLESFAPGVVCVGLSFGLWG